MRAIRYFRHQLLKKHTSFRIGGPADYLCVPQSPAEVKEALAFARENRLQVTVMGAGTNLLALDNGFRGMVIKLAGGLAHLTARGRIVHAGAGVFLPRLLCLAARRGLGGLEFLAGIPGSVGGAAAMNAGAWGKEIGQFIERVKGLDKQGREKEIRRKALKFGYRKSVLQNGKLIVTEVVLRLRKSKRKKINEKIKEVLNKRRDHQPLGSPNAGSIFKNPPGQFAGRLLEEAGCKGLRAGDAQISTKHANFILNLGDAKARDVIKLMTLAQKKVKDKFKIRLEPELKIMVKSPQ